MPIGQVASRHYLRFAMGGRLDLLSCLPRWLQKSGIKVQQSVFVQHPQDATQDSWVVLTPSLAGDVLVDKLTVLKRKVKDLEPAAVWRVEDLNLS